MAGLLSTAMFLMKRGDNVSPTSFKGVVVHINEISFKMQFEFFRLEVLDKKIWVIELVR